MSVEEELETRRHDGADGVIGAEEAVVGRIEEIDRVDSDDVTGRIQRVTIIDNPGDDLRQLAGLDGPAGDSPGERAAANRLRDADSALGTAVGADDWRLAPRVAKIEVELESGERFTDAFRVPRAAAEGELYDLCEALGVVPGSGETLEGVAVPVKRTHDGWKITVPGSGAAAEETPVDTRIASALSLAMMSGALLVLGGLVADAKTMAAIGFGIFLLGMTALDEHTPD